MASVKPVETINTSNPSIKHYSDFNVRYDIDECVLFWIVIDDVGSVELETLGGGGLHRARLENSFDFQQGFAFGLRQTEENEEDSHQVAGAVEPVGAVTAQRQLHLREGEQDDEEAAQVDPHGQGAEEIAVLEREQFAHDHVRHVRVTDRIGEDEGAQTS